MGYYEHTTLNLASGEEVEVTFTDASHAHVATSIASGSWGDGRHSVKVNGVPVTFSLHFYRPEGEVRQTLPIDPWHIKESEVSSHSLGRADHFLRKPSEATRRKFLNTVVPEIGALLAELAASSTIAVDAERSDARREAERAQSHLAKKLEEVAEAERACDAALARLAALAGIEGEIPLDTPVS